MRPIVTGCILKQRINLANQTGASTPAKIFGTLLFNQPPKTNCQDASALTCAYSQAWRL